MTNKVAIDVEAKGAKAAAKDVKDVQSAWETFQKKGAQGFAIGASAAVTTKAFDLVGDAISSVSGFLVDSVGKAREEQVGIDKLTSSLKANVASWDGNSDAIEQVIAAREKLAFSDGEQRDALAQLVTRTHDVTKALDLERIAMDLARLRGIDLATSSEIIGKVYGGNIGILGRYGIAVKKGSTATQALAEIQRAAAGQAETFANTSAGAAQGAQIALEDLQEEIGNELLPVVTDLSKWARDEGVPALRGLLDVAKDLAPVLGAIPDALARDQQDLESGFDRLQSQFHSTKDGATELSASLPEVTKEVHRLGTVSGTAAGGVGDVGDEAADAREHVKGLGGAAQKAADAFADLRRDAKRAGDAVAEAAYGPRELKLEFEKNRSELKDNQKEQDRLADKIKDLRSKGEPVPKALKDKFRDMQLQVIDSKQAVIDTGIQLHSIGGITMPQLEATFRRQLIKLDDLSGAAREYWAWLHKIANAGPFQAGGGGISGGASGNPKDPFRNKAVGGYVPPGAASWVGEKQAEVITALPGGGVMVDASPGNMYPRSSSGGMGGSLVININGVSVLEAGAAQRIADALAPHVTKWQQDRRVYR